MGRGRLGCARRSRLGRPGHKPQGRTCVFAQLCSRSFMPRRTQAASAARRWREASAHRGRTAMNGPCYGNAPHEWGFRTGRGPPWAQAHGYNPHRGVAPMGGRPLKGALSSPKALTLRQLSDAAGNGATHLACTMRSNRGLRMLPQPLGGWRRGALHLQAR